MSPVQSVEEAKADARAARARLIASLEELQTRFMPSRLMNDALDEMKTRSADLAQDAGRIARERPAMVAAGTLAGLALLFRKPLWRLGRRLLRKAEETSSDDLGLETDAPYAKG